MKVKCFIDTNVCSILNCDKVQLIHVLGNFISNSIKFSNPESIIEIFISYENKLPKHITFLVKDNGVGVSKSDQYAMFEPFLLLSHGDLQKGKGSGLGLAICKNLIQLHNGTIGFNSYSQLDYDDIPSGSEFFFNIPAIPNKTTTQMHDKNIISEFNREYSMKIYQNNNNNKNNEKNSPGLKINNSSRSEISPKILIVDGFIFIIFMIIIIIIITIIVNYYYYYYYYYF